MLTKRSLLTSLINALSALPTPDAPASNPLKSFATSPDIKNIFFTLHVLFPAELLPALDLLDRGMVHRLVLTSDPGTPAQEANQDTTHDPSTLTHPPSTHPQSGLQIPHIPEKNPGKRTYIVSSTLLSSRPHSSSRFHRPHPSPSTASPSHHGPVSTHGPSPTYTPSSIASRLHDPPLDTDDPTDTGLDEAARFHHVRVDGWWCGCPAFAFALFPSRPPQARVGRGRGGGGKEGREDGGEGERWRGEGAAAGVGDEWDAGGLLRGGEVPMCKHLLACLLVERCGALFGGFVKEREVGMEEWVGWGAGWGG
ncbi:hypothetical protein BDZ85DRAFT_297344 [Elsinoe ampelina]|uniref:SWIM-type domain-containing protein n=1 Tax=Elsinoe ampelina TaxID=302913 RepID=A0A6A6G6T7_9PEZI|nr:hypothetical protein BDZ85DRAFT_297344 [Elsinoe ampelina]